MKTYLVKQKFRMGGERFTINNDLGMVEYRVEGSFMKIPKTFTVFDVEGREVSHITKETRHSLTQVHRSTKGWKEF